VLRALSSLLGSIGRRYALTGFSALDAYHRAAWPGAAFAATDAQHAELARLFPSISFPGVELADAAVPIEGGILYLRCVDDPFAAPARAFKQLELLYDPERKVFADKAEAYPTLRQGSALEPGSGAPDATSPLEAAILVARYGYARGEARLARPAGEAGVPGPEAQRALLMGLLDARDPGAGFDLLADTGFVAAAWPELEALRGTEHAKDYHPEGDAWRHTMDTFKYRKTRDPRLALALLLHDAGKPMADSEGGKKFSMHAEIGEKAARGFMRHLGYDAGFASDVAFLVRNHMLPLGLPRIPPDAIRAELASPLVPRLLALFRCDLAATWARPDAYYEACAAYKAWLKASRNPYGKAETKRLMRELGI